MKKLLKSFMSIVIALVACYYLPLCSFASFDIYNSNYIGVYNNLSNQLSYVEINKSGYCNVSIVYSTLEKQFLTATKGSGYITNKKFRAEFSSYIIKSSSGTTIKVVKNETYLVGTVDYESKYIDIIMDGGIIYELTR